MRMELFFEIVVVRNVIITECVILLVIRKKKKSMIMIKFLFNLILSILEIYLISLGTYDS